MLLATRVGLGPGDIVLDGDLGHSCPIFQPVFIVVKWLPISATAEHLW